MLVTLSGMVIEVKLVAPENAEFPMLFNEESCDIVTEDKSLASLNAPFPMLVTLSGMIIEVKFDAPLNA